jgi:integrase
MLLPSGRSLGGCNLKENAMSVYKRGKKSTHWHYYFRVRGVRYRGAIPEARTKREAEQAELKIKQDIFEGRFGRKNIGARQIGEFIDQVYLPWAKANKRSWRDDEYKLPVLKSYFRGKCFRDISPFAVERFKQMRLATPTKQDLRRADATVNLELALLSRVFSLAMDFKEADSNPCRKVAKLRLDNQRYRYLFPEEELRLREALTGQRSHLADLVPVAIGTGLRKNEQLSLQVKHVDFVRGLIVVTGTKTRKNREVPMNSEVREILSRLCRGKRSDDYVFVSRRTRTRLTDVKRAFSKACEVAKISGMVWHDLRATFGTRLGEAGYDAFTIASLMGHDRIETTRRYVRATERNKRAAVQAAMLAGAVHKLAAKADLVVQQQADRLTQLFSLG